MTFPEELDLIEAEHDAAIAEDSLAAEFAAHAERTWALKAISYALARLYYAGLVQGNNETRRQADDAADALHAASKLALEPNRTALLRLSARLNGAIEHTGHLNSAEIEAVSEEVEQIKDAIKEGIRNDRRRMQQRRSARACPRAAP